MKLGDYLFVLSIALWTFLVRRHYSFSAIEKRLDKDRIERRVKARSHLKIVK